MFKCSKCKEQIPEENRSKKSKKRNGDPVDVCKECNNIYYKSWLYKITEAEVIELLQETNCGICEREVSGRNKVIDHCHETGKVRGVLCRPVSYTHLTLPTKRIV